MRADPRCALWPQLGVDLLRKIDAPALVEQVIAVPNISLDKVPRSVCRRSRRAEQLVEVPAIVSYSSLQQRTAEQIIDIPVPHGRGDRGGRGGGGGNKGYAQRIQQRWVEQITLTFQFLRVVAALEVLKVSSRVLLVLHPRTRLVPWKRLLQGFSHFSPKSKKVRGWVRTRGRNWVRTLIHGLWRLMATPWRLRMTSQSQGRSTDLRWRRKQRLVLVLAFGLCWSACGSWSSTWVGQHGVWPLCQVHLRTLMG